jgi:hypothetical protein
MQRSVPFVLFITVVVMFAVPAAADFTEGHLFIVNEPSSGSAGNDFVLEFDPAGTNLATLVPDTLGIAGMRRLAFDGTTGHLLYSVSNYSTTTYEIRELDSDGSLLQTYTHPDFDSGNISMVFDRSGNLFIANGDYIYRKAAGSPDIVRMFTLPYTGIGDLAIDSAGNLYLSDPFIDDVVYRISKDGTVTAFAAFADGVHRPYGLAVDADDNLYIANSSNQYPAIIRITPDGSASVFSDDLDTAGVLDMTFDENGVLYASNRSAETIHTLDADGVATLFADSTDGLDDPSALAFIITRPPCLPDTDTDGDVDGSDLATFAAAVDRGCMTGFAASFGM